MLSNRDIAAYMSSGRIAIEPKPFVETNGVDLTIGKEVATDAGYPSGPISPYDQISVKKSYHVQAIPKEGMLLQPRQFYLLHSRETITLDNTVAGIVKLKSTWARLGLVVPPTVINAGSSGEVVAEVFNFRNAPMLIRRGTPFLRILFEKLSSPATGDLSKKSQYFGQKGVRLPKTLLGGVK